jgi:hypothetical protein
MIKIFVFSLQLFLFSAANAQEPNELVVQVPGVESRNYNQVFSLISEVQYVKITHYCAQQDLFLIQLNRDSKGSHVPIDEIRERMQSLGFTVYVKEGRSHSEIIAENECVTVVNSKE